MKRVLVLCLAFALLTGCAQPPAPAAPSPSRQEQNAPPRPQQENGVSLAYRAGEDLLQVHGENGWEDIYINGVDIGAGKPGCFPGELGITYEDYYRWFGYISDLGANAIRVYTILMPDFYRALYDYNACAEKPLFFFQGVYTDEALVERYGNVFGGNRAVYNSFVSDIRDCIDVVHGSARLEPRAGHAGGSYEYDVSGWLMGWIIGIEFDSYTIEKTNVLASELTEYQGQYISIRDASAFEVFLSMTMDATVAYETERYAVQRPVAFSNWPTSDPFDHPDEIYQEAENGPGFDETKLIREPSFLAGLFISYHIYPCYPDFLILGSVYFQDDPPNSYLAYIRDLKRHYGSMPLIVSELGVPSSRGVAHRDDNLGRHQGGHTEREQGEAIVSLLRDVKEAGCGGGIVFSWQDEWFKKTWNTSDYDDPERRAYWSNIQTAEQCYGLLTFDPGAVESVVTLDGKDREWENIPSTAVYNGLEVKLASDERYLYLHINTDGDFQLGFDVNPELGNTRYEGMDLGRGTDFLLRRTGSQAELLVDPYYYPMYFLERYVYGETGLRYTSGTPIRDSGLFSPIDMLLRRTVRFEGQVLSECSVCRTGTLREGNGDPGAQEFDSLADYCVGDGFTELRLPWSLLNFADPSTGTIIGDLYDSSTPEIPFRTVSGIGVGLFDAAGSAWGQFYLANWDTPVYHERLKQSYYILQDYWRQPQ